MSTSECKCVDARLCRERVRIPGPRGNLDAELCYPEGETRFACLLVNPHPYMGGRMANNVIAHLAESLARSGGVTLRFDYAGVGESDGAPVDVAKSMSIFWETGRAPEDELMVHDARSALAWLTEQCDQSLVLLGYSFGAYVAGLMAEEVTGLILISPTLTHHDFSAAANRGIPKLVVYGDEDFATLPETVERWVETVRGVKAVQYIPGGAHFFKGCECVIGEACDRFASSLFDRVTS